jgi:[acyl-carrier-protein] S-malonyltransferase
MNSSATQYILCPGQGAQAVGMGKEFFEASSAARELFAAAGRILGFDLAAVCFAGPEERLNQTDVSQPALFVAGTASFLAAGIDRAEVAAYAGLSLGEYTALHLAGSMTFEDGLRLVAARGRFMQEAAAATAGGMVAIIGADESQVQEICQSAANGQELAAANFNAPGQIVISGAGEACGRAILEAEKRGFRVSPLKVAGAFHSPLMKMAAKKMEAELARTPLKETQVPVYSNVTAKPHTDVESMRRLLVEQIIKPVRWEQTMRALLGNGGGGRFVELCPGRTLAGLAKRIDRKLVVQSVSVGVEVGSGGHGSGS